MASGLLLAATVVAANTMTTRLGVVQIGFGLAAPAGVYAVGLLLVLRNVVQAALGSRGAWAVVFAGTGLSLATADANIVLASGAAFAFSETLALAGFALLERRWPALCLVVSAAAAAIADSMVFLFLAFGPPTLWTLLPGQLLGKTLGALAALLVLRVLGLAVRLAAGLVIRRAIGPAVSSVLGAVADALTAANARRRDDAR
ncbi:VUT family protein [Fodinicola acaciae]|uniref:VUT family protein n=1 Tax=Fodinicola acaciae TaxID=2681555 RepID=UPI0013D663FA|nr:VUT family protein [Fodinicola acaciae]